jgi:hypothetical protein
VDLTTFKPSAATVQDVIVSGRIDQGDSTVQVEYVDGTFSAVEHVDQPPLSLVVRTQLTPQELPPLLQALEQARHAHPQGLDVKALDAMIDVVKHQIGPAPSSLFDHVRFGEITDQPGIARELLGHYSAGIDMVGLIDDVAGVLSYAQRPIPLPPGPFRPIRGGDAASLARALEAYLDGGVAEPEASRWRQVLEDARAAAG